MHVLTWAANGLDGFHDSICSFCLLSGMSSSATREWASMVKHLRTVRKLLDIVVAYPDLTVGIR